MRPTRSQYCSFSCNVRNSYNHFTDARCILCVHTWWHPHMPHMCGCTHVWNVLHCAHTDVVTCIQNTGYIDLRKSNKQTPTCVHKVVEDDPHTYICMSSHSDMLSQWPVANWPLHYTACFLCAFHSYNDSALHEECKQEYLHMKEEFERTGVRQKLKRM